MTQRIGMFAALFIGLGIAVSSFAATEKPLADRLGGYTSIKKVVDEFVTKCATDPRISSFFTETAKDKSKLTAFKKNLTDQICKEAGGTFDKAGKKPCTYSGLDMKTAHAGRHIKEEHFDALVDDLTKTLEMKKFKVGAKERNELLGALATMKGDIVESTSATTDTATTTAPAAN